MSKTDQFTVTRWARGCKLTVQHQFAPLQSAATTAVNANLQDTQEDLGANLAQWNLPWLAGGAVNSTGGPPPVAVDNPVGKYPLFTWPFTFPPFQQKFNRTLFTDPQYRVVLSELSLSFDQRATAYAIDGTIADNANPVAVDMTRLNMVLRLLERTPSLLSGDKITSTEVFRIDIYGPDAFGNVDATGATISPALAPNTELPHLNPFLVGNVNVTLDPWKIYVWELTCQGLLPTAPDTVILALPSINIVPTLLSPLLPRDFPADLTEPQNAPAGYPGLQNYPFLDVVVQGPVIPLTVATTNALITGDDIQTALQAFERQLRLGAASGLGVAADGMQAADQPPLVMLPNDSHYCMIVVPLWSGQAQESVRVRDVAACRLPHTQPSPDDELLTWDERAVDLPENFVLHHAFAVWNGYSPPESTYADHNAAGTFPTVAGSGYQQSVGIIINSSEGGDNARLQNVAGVEFSPVAGDGIAAYTDYLLDEYSPYGYANYRMLQIPLVYPDATWNNNSWFPSGLPFFMGTGDSRTASRTLCSDMPAAAFGQSRTLGCENTLHVKWRKYAKSLSALDQDNVICGQGGEWVILCGKISVGR